MSKVKLQCWIARDKDGELNVGTNRPKLDGEKRWWINWDDFMTLPKSFFREVTFYNSPQMAEMTIDFREVTIHNIPQKVETTIEIKNYGKEEGA